MFKWSWRISFKDISIRVKLIIVFIVISLIPILILGLVSYRISSNVILQKEVAEKLNRLELIAKKVEETLKDKQFTGIKFSMDPKVLYLLGNETKLGEEEKRKYEFEIKKMLYDSSNVNGTLSISIISKNNIKYTNEQIASTEKVPDEWTKYNGFANGAATYQWLDAKQTNEVYVVPLVRKIVNSELETVGLLIINLKEDVLAETYKSYEINDPISYYVVNTNGNIISCLDKSMLGTSFNTRFSISAEVMDSTNGFLEKRIRGVDYLLIYSRDQISGLKFVSVIQRQELLKSTEYIKSLTLIICILCLIICLIASIIISNSISHPIRRLIGSIENIKSGALDVNLEINRNDEIGKLGQNYNSLIQELKNVIKDFYNEQKMKREAEMKVLQFQIAPHFLYNTLSSVIWLCEEQDYKSAIKVTKALANFFRISINKGKEFVSIREEVAHVNHYLEIQKVRYHGEFSTDFEIDPLVNHYFSPKIILQPLVENAIYHGIRNLKKGEGHILIKCYKEGQDIFFEVWDNGASLTAEKVNRINQFLRKEMDFNALGENFGIGISNVNDRIIMYFGSGYGLTFQKEDGFTVARIRIKELVEGDLHV